MRDFFFNNACYLELYMGSVMSVVYVFLHSVYIKLMVKVDKMDVMCNFKYR